MSEQFKIEEGVPIPKRASKTSYPFAQMEIGDSFVVNNSQMLKVRAAGYYFTRKNPTYKFVTHAGADGIRVWRIEAKP